jgi:hypothetical protein
MQPKDILILSNTFLKLAKEPSFEPEEIDTGARHTDPMDDDYSPGPDPMEGIETSDVGSNYGYLTPSLPDLKYDEIDTFRDMANDLHEQMMPNIKQMRDNLLAINTSDTFLSKSKRALEHTISNIKQCFERIEAGSSRAEDTISAFRENARQAKYIYKALSDLIEHNREQEIDEATSKLARVASSIAVMSYHIAKRLNTLLTMSYRKRQEGGGWDFDK